MTAEGERFTTAAQIRRLHAGDTEIMRLLCAMFARAFDDPESYESRPPSDGYLRSFLGRSDAIVLAALDSNATVIGGMVAYVLEKFEQERSEIYIYDLAVDAAHRRRGIARRLIGELRGIARGLGAYVMYVQADPPDAAAIALYASLGTREDVYHFDIPVEPS